ncbi:tetratricopeptide repeat protein [Chloroflexota bacterium]
MNEESKDEIKTILYSGQIIGAIVEALDIKDDALTDKTAKRYYSGKNVSKYSLNRIYIALGKELVKLNIVPIPQMFEKHGISMPNITTASLARLSKKWDSLCATIQSRSGNIQDYAQAVEGFCRLIIIDFALRIVAWLRLSNQSPPELKTPQWAEANGAGMMLRMLLSETGITRDQFSARVEVSHISIDNWFDGRIRPIPKNIEVISETFSKLLLDTNKYSLQVQFQRQFTFAYLADILAKNIGREAVLELATALYRFIRLISEDISKMERPPIEDVAGLEFAILRYGTDEPSSHTLLRNLALVEKDAKWQKDVLASITGWDLRFEEIVYQNSAPGAPAGLAQDLPEKAKMEEIEDGTEEELRKHKETRSLQAKDYTRIDSGDLRMAFEQFNGGINGLQLIVKRHPLSPQAHSMLGSYLGMVGKHLRNQEMINEGISECKIAAALCNDWDMPLVEPAIILINIGRYDEALVELDIAAKQLSNITPHLALNRGYALMQTNKFEQALDDFEFVISMRPNYALALVHAAHCAFMLHDHQKGIRYAKEARNYGEPRTYNDWRKGVYRN